MGVDGASVVEQLELIENISVCHLRCQEDFSLP